MGVESSFNYPSDLVATNPLEADSRRQGGTHLRGIKNVIKNVFKKAGGGAVITQSVFDQMYPLGSCIVTPALGEASRPDDDIGGTWLRCGSLTYTTTGKETGANDLTSYGVALWQRMA